MIHGPDAPAGNLGALRSHGIELVGVDDAHDPHQVAVALGDYGFNEVLVEGGAQVHGSFLRAGLYDRLELYVGAATLGGGLGVCAGAGVGLMREAQRWQAEDAPRVLGDTVCLRLCKPQPELGDHEPLVVLG